MLTLTFLLITFTVLTALLGFSFTANRTVNTYRTDRALRYAADSALTAAVQMVKEDPTLGIDPDVPCGLVMFVDGDDLTGTAIPDPSNLFADGSQVVVRCRPTGVGSGLAGDTGQGARDVTFEVSCNGLGPPGDDGMITCGAGFSEADADLLGEARVRYDVDPGHPVPAERARVPKVMSWQLNR